HAICSPRVLHSFPTRRSSDLTLSVAGGRVQRQLRALRGHPDVTNRARASFIGDGEGGFLGRGGEPSQAVGAAVRKGGHDTGTARSEEHTSELQSRENLVCRLL